MLRQFRFPDILEHFRLRLENGELAPGQFHFLILLPESNFQAWDVVNEVSFINLSNPFLLFQKTRVCISHL